MMHGRQPPQHAVILHLGVRRCTWASHMQKKSALTGKRRKWASWLALVVLLGLLLALAWCRASSGLRPGLSAQFCFNLQVH